MKKALFALILMLVSTITSASDLTDKLQDASVTVKTPTGFGTGVLVTRTIEGTDFTFVLTAGHIVADRKAKDFKDVYVVKELRQDLKVVAKVTADCRVLAYSEADDLALLVIAKTDLTKATTEFYLEDKIPEVGTELYHVGNFLGEKGTNSVATGIISYIDRILDIDGPTFDQTSTIAFPGSSGGGMYRKTDGVCLGVLVRGNGVGFNAMVPVRRIVSWCKTVNAEWLVDPKSNLPTKDELSKMKP